MSVHEDTISDELESEQEARMWWAVEIVRGDPEWWRSTSVREVLAALTADWQWTGQGRQLGCEIFGSVVRGICDRWRTAAVLRQMQIDQDDERFDIPSVDEVVSFLRVLLPPSIASDRAIVEAPEGQGAIRTLLTGIPLHLRGEFFRKLEDIDKWLRSGLSPPDFYKDYIIESLRRMPSDELMVHAMLWHELMTDQHACDTWVGQLRRRWSGDEEPPLDMDAPDSLDTPFLIQRVSNKGTPRLKRTLWRALRKDFDNMPPTLATRIARVVSVTLSNWHIPAQRVAQQVWDWLQYLTPTSEEAMTYLDTLFNLLRAAGELSPFTPMELQEYVWNLLQMSTPASQRDHVRMLMRDLFSVYPKPDNPDLVRIVAASMCSGIDPQSGLLSAGHIETCLDSVAEYPEWAEHPTIIRAIADMLELAPPTMPYDRSLLEGILKIPRWGADPRIANAVVRRLTEGATPTQDCVEVIVKTPWLRRHPAIVAALPRLINVVSSMSFAKVLTAVAEAPELQTEELGTTIALVLAAHPIQWLDADQTIPLVYAVKTWRTLPEVRFYIRSILFDLNHLAQSLDILRGLPDWAEDPQIQDSLIAALDFLIQQRYLTGAIVNAFRVVSKHPSWRSDPRVIDIVLRQTYNALRYHVKSFLKLVGTVPDWATNPQIQSLLQEHVD
ncbi:MAG: hypothetical protein DRP79_08670 [Planctomycetota bacterium]|nr:MAG: hypothetical protein DRP79_08670 [Planctomycetota bacterium]